MPSNQKNEGKGILSLDFELFIGAYKALFLLILILLPAAFELFCTNYKSLPSRPPLRFTLRFRQSESLYVVDRDPDVFSPNLESETLPIHFMRSLYKSCCIQIVRTV